VKTLFTSVTFFLLLASLTFSQSEYEIRSAVDSLKYVIATTKDDSIKIEAYTAWDDLIYLSDPDLDVELNQRIDAIASFQLSKNISKSRQLYFKEQKAAANNIIGIFYEDRGVYPLALKFHTQSLKIRTELKDELAMASSYNNLGILYTDFGDTSLAFMYYRKAIKIWEKHEDYKGLGNVYSNVGLVYTNNKLFDKALTYYNKGLVNFTKAVDSIGIGLIYFNIATTNVKQNNLDTARHYFMECLEINTRLNYHDRVSSCLSQLAYLENLEGEKLKASNPNQAREYYLKGKALSLKALHFAELSNTPSNIIDGANQLYGSLKGLKQYKEANEVLEFWKDQEDSLRIAGNSAELINQKFQFEYDQQVARDSIQIAEQKKVVAAELEKEKTQRYALYGGLFLLLVFGGFIYNRFRKSQMQNNIIQEQKLVVMEKNAEIMDSINYAKRIQAAILPPQSLMDELLPQNFVLYLPKDIVAGDFYWIQRLENEVLLAAADCTGHGVPGALVSVVCNNALNRAVKEFSESEPGKILDKTREIVIDEFSKSDENVKDGMDIALCRIGAQSIAFAGANNPLWILRNGEIIEIKADKQPVSNYDYKKSYTTHKMNLEKGDMLYLFSDGYVDQFGGEKGKKFKAKALKELIISMANLSLDEQKQTLKEAFDKWKGFGEQVDDVCVIGVRC
jgi:serine phosphatase RsbU (regulator of sigma subunit)/Tfp pilus assembly protein PilF